MTDTVSIRSGNVSEAGQLGRLIGESFIHLEVTRWLVEKEEHRVPALAGQFEMLVAHAIEHGDVYVAEDVSTGEPAGVGVWFPHTPIPDIEDYDARLAAACGPYVSRFAELDAAMHAAHPTSPDHAYLLFLAVGESARNRGIGTALLKEHHVLLDKEGIPAYLDASGLHSRELYLRHGYVDHAPPYGVGGLTGFYPMWRPAQASNGAG